jgi:hypothetical protein
MVFSGIGSLPVALLAASICQERDLMSTPPVAIAQPFRIKPMLWPDVRRSAGLPRASESGAKNRLSGRPWEGSHATKSYAVGLEMSCPGGA